MLGLGKRQKPATKWQWDVVGKHPAARDFFAFGKKALMAEALSEWIQRGAENLITVGKELLVQSCSWRFWARTPQAGMLACGVIRNSCDAVGRPFPLLVMGTGRLDNWEAHWELLPFACEGLWRQMEQLGSRKYASLEVFQEDVNMLRPPRGRWKEMELEKIAHAAKDASCLNVDFHLDLFKQERALFLPFQDTGQDDFFIIIDNVHSLLKMQVKTAPNSLFMGGLIEQPGLALFQRPLCGQDFQRMWMPGTN